MEDCEKLELVLAILLGISELLPFIKNKESCNGIINTIFCMVKKGEQCKDIEDDKPIIINRKKSI